MIKSGCRLMRGAPDKSFSPARMHRQLLTVLCTALIAPAPGLAAGVQDSLFALVDSVTVHEHPVFLASESGDVPVAREAGMPITPFEQLWRLPDALEEQTGALTPESSRLTGGPLVRGMSAHRSAVSIDDIPIGHSGLRDASSVLPVGAIESNMLSGFEISRGPVIRGGTSTGVAGAIRIKTALNTVSDDLDGSTIPDVTVTQRVTSADRGWSGALSARGTIGGLKYQVGGSGRLLGDLRVGSSDGLDASIQANTSLRETTMHTMLAFKVSERWAIRGTVISSWREGQSSVEELASLRITTLPASMAVFEPRRFTLAYVTSRVKGLGPVEDLQSSIWYNAYRESRTFRRRGWQHTAFDDDVLAVAGARTEVRLRPIGRHTLTVEADLHVEGTRATRWEMRDDGSVWGQRGRYPEGSRSNVVAFGIGDEWGLDDGLQASASARWTRRATHSDYGPSLFGQTGVVELVDSRFDGWSWHGSVDKDWGSGWGLSASISSVHRAPGLDEMVANAYWLYGRDVPNPGLRPERATEVQLSGRFELGGLSATATAFRTRYRSFIRRDWFEAGPDDVVGTVDDLFRFTNMRSTSISGAEIDVIAGLGSIWGFDSSVSGVVALHRWESRDSAVPHYLPPAVGRVGSRFARGSYWLEPFVRFSAPARAVDYSVAGRMTGDTPGWATWNVRGGVRFGEGLMIGVALENVRDKRYVEHSSYILAPGRNLTISGSYRF